jgi:hypothetical protein
VKKITLTIEGEIEELGTILSKLGELKESGKIGINTQNSLATQEWTRQRVLLVWNDLSENVKGILGVIARNDDKSWEEQLRVIGRSGQAVGGSLSSLGARLRNHSLRGISYPLFDNDAYGYKLLPIWKEIVLELTS